MLPTPPAKHGAQGTSPLALLALAPHAACVGAAAACCCTCLPSTPQPAPNTNSTLNSSWPTGSWYRLSYGDSLGVGPDRHFCSAHAVTSNQLQECRNTKGGGAPGLQDPAHCTGAATHLFCCCAEPCMVLIPVLCRLCWPDMHVMRAAVLCCVHSADLV